MIVTAARMRLSAANAKTIADGGLSQAEPVAQTRFRRWGLTLPPRCDGLRSPAEQGAGRE
jgi:hypothetical protein